MNIETFIDYDNKLLKCGICGKWFKPLSNNIIKFHIMVF